MFVLLLVFWRGERWWGGGERRKKRDGGVREESWDKCGGDDVMWMKRRTKKIRNKIKHKKQKREKEKDTLAKKNKQDNHQLENISLF